MQTKRILWYIIHPSLNTTSRGNRALLEAVKSIPGTTFVDLYSEYPDFKIDVAKEQQRLVANDLIVFEHPLYWYAAPALLKEWQDKVLTYGFAYPPKVGKALQGKTWLSVVTTGGPAFAYTSGGYNNFTMSELLRTYQQTAYLCGMNWLPPFVVHGVLPGDFEGIKATPDDQIKLKAKELADYVSGLDLTRRHSIEPVVAPHFLDNRGNFGGN